MPETSFSAKVIACVTVLAVTLLAGISSTAAAAANAPLPLLAPRPGITIDFEHDVYPILKANCIACHNKTTTKADLNMETPELMKVGGESGTGLIPGQADKSSLFQAANHTWESIMPPKGNKVGAVNLTPEELGLLKAWIDQGAKGGLKKHQEIAWQPLPPGLNPIYATAITPDGGLAVCSRANQIWIYDLATRQLVTRLTDDAIVKEGAAPGVAHRDLVQALAFSPDGQWLASGSFQEIKLWQRLSPSATFKLTTAPLSAPVNAADAKRVAAELKIPATQPAALSADGKWLATATTDGIVHLWNAVTKKAGLDLRSNLAAEQNKDKLRWQISRQQLEGTYQASFIAQTEAEIKALDDRLKKAQDAIVTAKKAQDEKQKAVPATQTAKVAADKEVKDVADLVAKLAAGTKPDAALEKRQKDAQAKLEKAAKDEETTLAAVKTAEDQAQDAEEEVKIIDAAKLKGTQTIADAKGAQAAAAKSLAAVTAEANKPAPFSAIDDAVTGIAFSADGIRVAALTHAGAFKVWSVETGAPLDFVPAPDKAQVAAARAKTAAVATTPPAPATIVSTTAPSAAPASSDLTISVISTAAGAFSWLSPDGRTGTLDTTSTWTLAKTLGGNVADSPLIDRVNALRFSPDGKTLAAGSGEPSRTGDITFWEIPSGKLIQAWKEKHHDSVLSLDYSPDGKLLASGGADKAIRVSEITGGKQVRLFEGHTHHVLGVAFRQDGRILASAGADNVVKIWDMISGDRKKNVEGWDKEVTSLQFLGATDSILTSAGDNKVRVVREAGTEVRTLGGLPDFMYSAAGSRSGILFIGGGQDSVLRLWEAEKGSPLAQFQP